MPRPAGRPRFVRFGPYRPENTALQTLKTRVRRLLVAWPALYWAVVPAFRGLQRLYGRLLLRASGTTHDRFLDVDRQARVDPAEIREIYGLKDSVLRNKGPGWVLDGDWDRQRSPFADDSRYIALRDVLTRGASWEETAYYRWAVERIERGIPQWYCRTREEYDERCRGIEALYRHIQEEGYLSQRELRERREPGALGGKGDEVSVAIARDGRFLFMDGAHRLAIAQLLDVPSIPVDVRLRHAGWMTFRRQIARYCELHGGAVPQPLQHPDLDDIPSLPGWEAVAGMLEAALAGRAAGVTVLGARWGYLCQRLEASGQACTAVESDREDIAFMKRLRRVGNHSFAVVAVAADDESAADEGGVSGDGGLAGDGSAADEVSAAAGGVPDVEAERPTVVAVGLDRHPQPDALPRFAQLAASLAPAEVFVSAPEPAPTGAAEADSREDPLALFTAACGLSRRELLGEAPGIGAVYRLS